MRKPLQAPNLQDKGSVTPMKSVVVDPQITLQPEVIQQYGANSGLFNFSGFNPGGVILMNLSPRYKIRIIDIWARATGTPALNDALEIRKIDSLGNSLLITTLKFVASKFDCKRYTAGDPAAVLSYFTIDPTIGEGIRVSSPAPSITGGCEVFIEFVLVN